MSTKNEIFIVLIFNNRKVEWHIVDSSYTIAHIYKDLERLFNIKKCMLDIEKHNFIKPSKILLQPLIRNPVGCDIHITIEDELVNHCVQNNRNRFRSKLPVWS